jgi:hypothetical protein
LASNPFGLKGLTMVGKSPSRIKSGSPGESDLAEFARVRARHEIRERGQLVPLGAVGTIVHVYEGGATFEVEFTSPVHAVVGADRDALELA